MESKGRKIVIWVYLVLFPLALSAQQDKREINTIGKHSYSTALGIRAGETSGITLKHYLSAQTALEGIFGFWPNGFGVAGMFEIHAPTQWFQGLRWYYGAGGHIAMQTRSWKREGVFYTREAGIGLGIDGILGLEYVIKPIPFAICMDLKPYIEVNTSGGIRVSPDPGLGIKFTF